MLALGLALTLLWAVVQHPALDSRAAVATLASPLLIVPNDCIILAVLAPFSVVLFYRRRGIFSGVLALASSIASLIAIIAVLSRTALLTLVVSLAIFFATDRRRLLSAAYTCALILLSAFAIDATVGFTLLNKSVDQWQGSGRLELWRAAWAMFVDAPLFGHGPHTFGPLQASYFRTLHIPFPVNAPWVHNIYLEALCEQGAVGLMALVVLLIHGIGRAWRLQHAPISDARILGMASFAALVGFCFAGLLELSFLRQWVTIVLFALLGVIAHLTRLEHQ